MDWGSLVGIPWRERGRERTGCDCYGLVRLAYREGRSVELPSYADGYASVADNAGIHQLIEGGKVAWDAVSLGEERAWDVVLMTLAGTDHVGLVIGPGLMLHMPAGSTSVIEPYTGIRFRERARRGGFYRFRP